MKYFEASATSDFWFEQHPDENGTCYVAGSFPAELLPIIREKMIALETEKNPTRG